jgi:hypothetical protein
VLHTSGLRQTTIRSAPTVRQTSPAHHRHICADRQVAVNGDVCVISKTHALEPFELPAMDQAGFWTEAIFVAERASYCTR